MYTTFERTQIRGLKAALPELGGELDALDAKLLDLKPVVERNVAHPDFGGSVSIKQMLPALVPGLSYEGLEVGDGLEASAELARLLLRGETLTGDERKAKREALLEYCCLDTLAMVRLLERLEELAATR